MSYRSRMGRRVNSGLISISSMIRHRRKPPVFDVDHANYDRPVTRADCINMQGPCPWVSCRHHLYLDVTSSGSIMINFHGGELSDMEETCSLRAADEKGATLEEVGRLMNVSRERIRQLEKSSMSAVKKKMKGEADG